LQYVRMVTYDVLLNNIPNNSIYRLFLTIFAYSFSLSVPRYEYDRIKRKLRPYDLNHLVIVFYEEKMKKFTRRIL